MEYNFIKNLYRDVVNDLNNDNESLKKLISERENSFILNHNIEALSKLLRFMNSPDNIFILNGFMGSGKTYVADCFLDFIDDDVLIFRNSYQEAINLDDVLLSMFKDFSIYHNEKNIILPKAETSIFSDKINSYIKYCNAPMLFIFDSFEINMRTKDTQKDILDFINFLSHFAKVKVVICSRTFKKEDLLSQTSSDNVDLKPLTIDEYFNFMNENGITGSKYECTELFKVSRGHYLLLELSVLIMKMLNMSLTNFSNEYKKSSKNFLEFLIYKILSVSSDKFLKLLLLLSSLRHGVSLNFLENQKFASEDDLDFLLLRHIVSEKFGKYYLKDYIKSEFIKTVNAETRIKIHKYILEVYNSELPRKPFDRELFLSRITMRQEIAYHLKKISQLEKDIEKNGKQKLSDIQDFTYLTYTRSLGFSPQINGKLSSERRNNRALKKSKDKNSRFKLSDIDSLLLNASKPDDLITKHFEQIVNSENNNQPENKEADASKSVPKNLEDYVAIAQSYEENFDFSSAVVYYKKALTFTDDKMFEYKEPIIYTKLAICYKKVQNFDEAVNYYERVYNLYLNSSPEKANEILLSIAQIYSEVYKFDNAKEVYKRILYSPNGVSPIMVVRVFLDLAELEDNNMNIENAVSYSKKAIEEAEKLSDIPMLCECYYKYASLLDDSGNIDTAIEYYLKCVQTSQDVNENDYLSSSYSNLAEISFDDNNLASAKMYFELSVEADKKSENYEGLYYSYLKLAKIFEEENNPNAHECLINALSASKNLDDINYQLSAYAEIADYYLRNYYYKKALKSYMIIKSIASNNMLNDMVLKYEGKINKLKLKLGEVEFLKLMNEVKNKK